MTAGKLPLVLLGQIRAATHLPFCAGYKRVCTAKAGFDRARSFARPVQFAEKSLGFSVKPITPPGTANMYAGACAFKASG